MLTGSAGLRLVAAIVAVLAGVLLWPSPLPQEPLPTLQGDEGDSGLKAWLDAGAAATGRPPLLGLQLAPGLDELQPAGSGAAVQLLRIEGAPPRAAPATKLAAAAESTEGMSAECQRLVAERQPLHRRFVRRGKSAGSMVTMPFALCATQQPDAKSFTLVTHTDIRVPQELLDPNQAQQQRNRTSGSRLSPREKRVLRLASRWHGVISVGARVEWSPLGLSEEAASPATQEGLPAQRARLRAALGRHLAAELPPDVADIATLDVHVVSYPGGYNRNLGRNVALQNARTPYVLVMDAEFVPPSSMSHILATKYQPLLCGSQTALVIPHFDVFAATTIFNRPISVNKQQGPSGLNPSPDQVNHQCRNKQTLRSGYVAGNVTRFHENDFKGTMGEDTDHWMVAKSPYRISSAYLEKTCHQTWDPIVAFHKTPVFPYFPEAFLGRLYDRQSHVMQLRWSSFDFVVPDDLFLCHSAERDVKSKVDMMDDQWNKQYYDTLWAPYTMVSVRSAKQLEMRRRVLRDVGQTCAAQASSGGRRDPPAACRPDSQLASGAGGEHVRAARMAAAWAC